MTVIIETLVFCDEPNCPRNGEPYSAEGLQSYGARHQLKGSGWLSKAGSHICDECRKINIPKPDETEKGE